MSKEPEQKTNQHAHIARAIKPNQTEYKSPFSKEEEKRGCFSNRPQTGSFWACLLKQKIKRGLNTTNHAVKYSNVCTVNSFKE